MRLRNATDSPIARRLALAIILFSSAITLITTSIQLYADYRREIRQIHDHFALIRTSYLKSLTNGVWMLDDIQITTLLEGLLKLPDIEQLVIHTEEGARWSAGSPSAAHAITEQMPLLFIHKGKEHPLGTLLIRASLDNVYQRLLEKALTILVTNAVKTFAVAGFILLIFRQMVTRHLTDLAGHMGRLDLKTDSRRTVRLNRKKRAAAPDELDQVVDAINRMQANLRQSLQQLLSSEKQYRELVENANSAILRLDTAGRITFVNGFACRLFGYEPAELIGRAAVGTIVPETDSLGRDLGERIKRICREPDRYPSQENENSCRDGRRLWMNWANKAITDEAGRLTEILCVGNDITRRKEAEAALMAEKEFTEFALNAQSDLFLVFVPETGSAVHWNAAFRRLTGYPDEKIRTLTAPDHYFDPNDLSRARRYLQRIQEGGSGTIILPLVTGSGERIPIEFSASVMERIAGRPDCITTVGRDVRARLKGEAQRQRLENRLMEARKMEAIGTLAGGIAHHFNNLLSIILGNTELAMEDIPKAHTAAPFLSEIETAALRARDVVRQLVSFSMQRDAARRPIRPAQLVQETVSLLRAALPEGQRFRLSLSEHAGPVLGNAAQLKQALIQICQNAAQSMKQQPGEIRITLSEEIVPAEGEGEDGPPEGGAFIRITIRDSGHGIPPADLKRIFDPFFTTREVGEGAGMGLAVAQGIVRAHGGEIRVESTPGRGSAFSIRLPRHSGKSAPADPHPTPPAQD